MIKVHLINKLLKINNLIHMDIVKMLILDVQ